MFVELLRGRDGLPGRDGVQGPPGPPGKDGTSGQQGTPVEQGPPGPSSGGAVLGKSSCPEVNDTELVYSGFTGGTDYTQSGGGANHLCMPEVPNTVPISHTEVLLMDMHICMGQSIKILYREHMIIMFPVLYVMYLLDRLYS